MVVEGRRQGGFARIFDEFEGVSLRDGFCFVLTQRRYGVYGMLLAAWRGCYGGCGVVELVVWWS